VLAVSAGNHAQGVALHARRLRIPATIVMPRHTPFVKVEATRAFGPRIVLEGDTLEEVRTRGLALARGEGLVFVHPYDDPQVIAGQGTIALEMLEMLEIEKTVVEGAGAAGLAALFVHRERFAGRRVGLVLCGGNIDPLLLAAIVRREMVRSGRLARLRIEVRDRPGALASMTAALAAAGSNVEEIQHQRIFGALSAELAAVEVVVQTRGEAHVAEVLATLAAAGFGGTRF
jgi:threonine dehydratase